MSVDDLKRAIHTCKKNGIKNILALRGDPPKNVDKWQKAENGFSYALDLVKLIKEETGDYFGIAVAGYPEGHPDGNYEDDLKYLKQKVDAGAEFVVTQLFYDCDQFLKFVKDAKEMGINVPIIPGIMPIQSYNGFKRMTTFCKTKIPEQITKDLAALNTENDDEVKAYGIRLGIQMCKFLLRNGIRGLHLYTLNLEKSCLKILEGLELISEAIPKSLPWVATANANRRNESVRPIFWSHRPISYVARTNFWDEYPNGRWGDSRSPAFGTLEDYHIGLYSKPSAEKRKQWWAEELNSVEQVNEVFVKFLEGKIPRLPWVESVADETNEIKTPILELNKKGFLTINSQPSINGIKSTDKVHGWGPQTPFGYIYKKAYLEFFCSPESFEKIKERLDKFPSLTVIASNVAGEVFTNSNINSVNAVTWGVFPAREIIQPTVVDGLSFLAWKPEAFSLWRSYWLEIYPEESTSRNIIKNIHDTYWLVSVVDNDYIAGDIFAIFKDL